MLCLPCFEFFENSLLGEVSEPQEVAKIALNLDKKAVMFIIVRLFAVLHMFYGIVAVTTRMLDHPGTFIPQDQLHDDLASEHSDLCNGSGITVHFGNDIGMLEMIGEACLSCLDFTTCFTDSQEGSLCKLFTQAHELT